jgi:hypothetical protein
LELASRVELPESNGVVLGSSEDKLTIKPRVGVDAKNNVRVARVELHIPSGRVEQL